ncbi:MAG: DNA repair protein RecN (Recombination protein N) [Flavobacteriaceae bacterium]|jgi:DNA repair protein RecN (Recombination protein N)
MIASLRIENFALIDEVAIRFNSGFTVITGETGSGKSILLNALSLILGERANFSIIGDRKDKSIVEAEIDVAEFNLEAFFKANELDYFDQCIVRREISKQGRSRAFINDIPVQLSTLRELSSQLVHIHSQYNTLELKDLAYQLNVLDILSGCKKETENYLSAYKIYEKDRRLLTSLKEKFSASSLLADYNQFQLTELDELRLTELDYEKIQTELASAENVDEIKLCYDELAQGLGGDNGVVDILQRLKSSLSKGSALDEGVKRLYKRLDSSLIELTDLSNEADSGLESIEVDPGRIIELSEQMNAFNKAIHKHNVSSQEELLNYWNELNATSVSGDVLQEEVEALESSLKTQFTALMSKSDALHEKRMKSIPEIESTIKKALHELKLVDTELIFRLSKLENLSETGSSKLEIYFSPNAGIEAVPVHRAASGGELSRVMLALQSLISVKTKLRTIFFDEIDTGVSGDVAQKVGNTLMKMGTGMQVIAITHLPQVAAKGGQHLKVNKSVVDGRTKSFVHELTMDQRIEETARLMSGDKINAAALENAKALMS